MYKRQDKILQFTDSLKAAGGQVVLMKPGDDINDIIRHHFPDAIRIASNLSSITCATFNPDDLDEDVYKRQSQFHPEACSGPTDTEFIFDKFVDLL